MKNLLLITILFSIISCGNASRNVDSKVSFTPPEVSDESSISETSEWAATDANKNSEPDAQKDLNKSVQKLIRNGYLTIEVDKYKETRKKISDIVKQNGGYIGNESETNETYRLTNDLTIRIPSANFDKVMELIINESIKTDSKRIEVTDVGEEYADLTTRMATKKAVEKRYLDILSKANKITDILEVEEKLRVIREEIEAAEGRIKYLDNQVSFSTIQLSMYKTLDTQYTPPSGPSFLTRIWKGIVQGWEGVINFIIGLVYLWPLWVIIALLIYWIKKRKKGFNFFRFRKNKNTENN
ncbi:MAG: DUF4349 domain-containing protein [Bacteroidia bacterium]|nr:DUF4349 domain-containing protein [Bacteroidia bacterium]